MISNNVFIKVTSLSQLSLNEMKSCHLLGKSLLEQTETFSATRQKQFIAGRFLLAKLLEQHYQKNKLPEIIIAQNSRPCFKEQNLPDFNISHSGDYIAVAITSNSKIGLDIEVHRQRKNFMAIAEQFFSKSEKSWLVEQPDQLSAFWELWTLRESAVKLYSKGVWQMKQLQIQMPDKTINAPFATEFYPKYQFTNNIHLSICCEMPITTCKIEQ